MSDASFFAPNIRITRAFYITSTRIGQPKIPLFLLLFFRSEIGFGGFLEQDGREPLRDPCSPRTLIPQSAQCICSKARCVNGGT